MASEVDICNLALTHLGDEANVVSINPPEKSVQATQCARLYPIARDQLLQSHNWGFATQRIALASVASDLASWPFSYVVPANILQPIAVLMPGTTSDDSSQEYIIESGRLYTAVEQAVLRYVWRVTDTAKYPPLVVTTLSYLLASYLAGPILKGKTGIGMRDKLMATATQMFSLAAAADSNGQKVNTYQNHKPVWISDR